MWGLVVLGIIILLSFLSCISKRQKDKKICTYCFYKGYPTTITQGSFLEEIFFWLCFIIPGVIYSLWRLSTKSHVCPSCHRTGVLISLYSPSGQILKKQYYEEEVIKEKKEKVLRIVK